MFSLPIQERIAGSLPHPPPPPSPRQRALEKLCSLAIQERIKSSTQITNISALAEVLDTEQPDSPAEAIATFMLRSQPPLPLLQRQKGQLFGLQRSIELLTLSEERIRSVCLVCADIFKKIRDAGRFVDRIQIILHASTWKSQVSDLQRLLEVDLRKCLSLDNVKQVDEAHLKLTQLSKDLHRYQKRLTVHVVSGLARVNQRAIHGTCGLIEMVRRHMQRDSPAAIAHETNTRDVNDNALQPVAETDHSVGRMLTSFCDVLVRLNRIEKNIFVVCVSLQTLVTALSSAHGKDVSSDIIQWLRDDSSMFEGVANCIRDCHSRLRDDLKDLRDVLAHCFRFLSEAWSWASPHSQLTSE